MKLDLTVLAMKTFDLTLLDGTEIHIRKPNKGLIVELNKASIDFGNAKDFEELMNLTENATLKIMNNNTEKRIFEQEDVEEIDYTMQTAIFKAYMGFIMEANNPN
ncbi:MAG: hypothetical protein AB9856_20880 [Cellulosilyticaceae bacterium]